MKKILYKFFIGIFVLLSLVSCANDTVMEVFISPVITEQAYVGYIPTTFTFTGTLSPNTETIISSKVSGVVLDIFKDVGDSVREGSVLAQIDSELSEVQLEGLNHNISSLLAQKNAVKSLYNQRIQDANVNLNNTLALNARLISILQTQISNATYTDLSNSKKIRDAGIDVLEEQLNALEDIQLKTAEKISDGQLIILKKQLDSSENDIDLNDLQYYVAEVESKANIKGIESQIEILEEQIDLAFTNGNASVDTVNDQIDLLEKQLSKAHSEIKLNTDQLRQVATLIELEKSSMLAELDSAISQLYSQKSQTELIENYATIRAPYDGVLIQKLVEVGQLVAPGSPIAKISTTDKFKVLVQIPDNLLSNISKIDTADVVFDALGDKVFVADVKTISPSTTIISKKITVELTMKEENDDFISGLFARVTFNMPVDNGLIVSSSAVISNYGQNYLFVNSSGVAEKRFVEIVSMDNDNIMIDGDILKGEEIIISGNKWLRDGDKVNAKPKLLSRY